MAKLYGSAQRRDGSKIDPTATISTSWNGNKAFPSGRRYPLDLGGNPRKSITVYVDGDYYGEVHIDFDTPFDIRM